MDSANSPPSTSVQESSGSAAGSSVVALPPERMSLLTPTQPPAPSGLVRADLLLSAFVVLLAFLLASTAARNSDLWLHLATGRAIVEGSYRFQGDPFGPDSSLWVAHSWLYDLISYGLYQSLGGASLVILKAALVALLAGLMVRLGTRERGMGWPAVCAAVALLALSGRLLLQPALVSALLLGVTLWLLGRARWLRAEKRASWLQAYGPLCLLFVLWANLDDWFLLGPATVALYLLGELVAVVAGGSEGKKADLPGLARMLVAGLLACLVTPFHIHGFTLPAELGLSATARVLQQDPVLKTLFISPFNETYYTVGAAWSVPGVGYLALAGPSGLSFALSPDAWRSWRLPVWLGLFALSAWSVRAVPFFAVAAGPILALNVQDYARRTRPPGRGTTCFCWRGWAGRERSFCCWLCSSRPGPAGCNCLPTRCAAGLSCPILPWWRRPNVSINGVRRVCCRPRIAVSTSRRKRPTTSPGSVQRKRASSIRGCAPPRRTRPTTSRFAVSCLKVCMRRRIGEASFVLAASITSFSMTAIMSGSRPCISV
jgi:hypothetical protein